MNELHNRWKRLGEEIRPEAADALRMVKSRAEVAPAPFTQRLASRVAGATLWAKAGAGLGAAALVAVSVVAVSHRTVPSGRIGSGATPAFVVPSPGDGSPAAVPTEQPSPAASAQAPRPTGSARPVASAANPTAASVPTAHPPAAPQTAWAAVGRAPLSDAAAAALVTHAPEIRPANTTANNYVPSSAELNAFYSATDTYGQTAVQSNPLYQSVTGRSGLSNPSTDDLIQWTAHKWGIPEDWIRATMVEQSDWNQGSLGGKQTVSSAWYSQYPPQAQLGGNQVYTEMGISGMKWLPDGSANPKGAEPLRWKSTAFSLDVWAASVRYYYDGLCDWCGAGYASGDSWRSIGGWYSASPWNGNSAANSYITSVQSTLSKRTWAQPGY
jgi:hypothetical protein